MAYSVVANTAIAGASSGATTGTITTTGANLLLLYTVWLKGQPTPTISDSKSNTWTKLTEYSSNPTVTNAIWYSTPSSVGTLHTFTNAGTLIFAPIFVIALSGAATSSPYDTPNENGHGGTGIGTYTLDTGSVTPSVNNCVLGTGMGYTINNSTPTIDLSFTVTDTIANSGGASFGGAMAYLIETTAAAKNPTWDSHSINNNEMINAIASFLPTAATGGFFARYYYDMRLP